jgi:hypothetical protein
MMYMTKTVTGSGEEPSKIDRTAPAGSKNSLGAESVRDGRPATDDSVEEAIDEMGPGISQAAAENMADDSKDASQDSSKDPWAGKGAVEDDAVRGSDVLAGQLGHRDQDEELKENDTDFPEPDAEAEHSGGPSAKVR